MQLIVERQVVLEAKIIEVTLREGFEAGINWAAFRDERQHPRRRRGRAARHLHRQHRSAGHADRAAAGRLHRSGFQPHRHARRRGVARRRGIGAPGAVFGLALQTSNFAALLAFLETQGSVNVLSSPRVATINNQKAVLKVGQDDFFVTNVSTTSTTSGTSTTISPTITVQPFFSGIALDVTPQIDENNNIILHIHPQVSRVVEQRKVVDLGDARRIHAAARLQQHQRDRHHRARAGRQHRGDRRASCGRNP